MLLLDPTSAELASSDAHVQVCLMPAVNELAHVAVTGSWKSVGAAAAAGAQGKGGPSLQQALQLGIAGCMQLRDEMRATLTEKVLAPAT